MTEITAHLIHGLAFAVFVALAIYTGIAGIKAMRSPAWSMQGALALLVFAGLTTYGALAIALGLVR